VYRYDSLSEPIIARAAQRSRDHADRRFLPIQYSIPFSFTFCYYWQRSLPLARSLLLLSTMEAEYPQDDDAQDMEVEDMNPDELPVTQEDAWAVIRLVL
jgi:hypothetical protein